MLISLFRSTWSFGDGLHGCLFNAWCSLISSFCYSSSNLISLSVCELQTFPRRPILYPCSSKSSSESCVSLGSLIFSVFTLILFFAVPASSSEVLLIFLSLFHLSKFWYELTNLRPWVSEWSRLTFYLNLSSMCFTSSLTTTSTSDGSFDGNGVVKIISFFYETLTSLIYSLSFDVPSRSFLFR